MSINTAGAKSPENIAQDDALDILSKDSILSQRFKRVVSILESWDGSLRIRDKVTEIIAGVLTYNNWLTADNTIDANNLKWQLVKYGSLKEKLAFLVSLNFRSFWWGGPWYNCNINNVRELIWEYLEKIENKINAEQNFSIKFTLRHAALNRFEVKLSLDESNKLNSIINDLSSIISENKLNYSFHLWKQTNAQKIRKVKEVLWLLNASNIPSDEKNKLTPIYTNFETLSSRLGPLDDLDKAYNNLSTTLNNMYSINRNSNKPIKNNSIISATDKRKLKTIVAIIDWKDPDNFNLQEYSKKLYNWNELDINVILESYLENPKIEEALKKVNVKENYFSRAFLEYFSREFAKIAKSNLESQKRKVFKNSRKDFEVDVNNILSVQRNKIIEIWRVITPGVPPSTDQISILTSYLIKNKHVFRTWSNVDDNNHIRTALRVAIDNIAVSATSQEKEILVNWILNQNKTINDIFYWDKNIFNEKNQTKNNLHKLLNGVGRIWDSFSWFFQKYWQATSKVILGGTAIAVWWTALAWIWMIPILTALWLAWWVKLWAKGLDKRLAKYHTWLNNKKSNKWWRKLPYYPLRLAKWLTKPLELLWYWIDKWSNKTFQLTKTVRNKVNDTIANKIWSKEWVKKLTDSEVKNTFSLVALWLNWICRAISEWTSFWSRFWIDMVDINEEKRILEWLYSTANAQNLRELAEQIEIQGIIQEDIWLENDEDIDTVSIDNVNIERPEMATFKKAMGNFDSKIKQIIENVDTSLPSLWADNRYESQLKKYLKWTLWQISNLLKDPQGNISTSLTRLMVNLNIAVNNEKVKYTNRQWDINTLIWKASKSRSDALDRPDGKWANDAKMHGEEISKLTKELDDIDKAIDIINGTLSVWWFIHTLIQIARDITNMTNNDFRDINIHLPIFSGNLDSMDTTII